MERNYYVYVYYRLDTNEPFYVGKGKGNRYKKLDNRGSHFKNIANSTPIAVEIVHDNLTEDEAHGIECYLIHELVFEYGFSIDIEGSNSNDHYCHLVNATWGGEGVSGYTHTEEQRQRQSERNSGEGNPMFGKGYLVSGESNGMFGKIRTEEWRQQHSERMSGENNPMFGKRGELSPSFGKCGELNPMFGKRGELSPNFGKHHSKETRQKMSEKSKGKNNSQATLYKVINSNGEIVGIFCGSEIYNNHSSKGFLNIGKDTFNKYIRVFGNIDISRLQGNNYNTKQLREKLTPYNGWQFIEISKEELETEVA